MINLIIMSTLTVEIMVSKYHCLPKATHILREISDVRIEIRNIQGEHASSLPKATNNKKKS